MENQFFKAIPLMEGVTAIAGLGGEYAYLVEGSERALLIDGLVGVGSLKAFVRELTSLPVKIALTHGHIDHNGAAYCTPARRRMTGVAWRWPATATPKPS